ncbi:MAG: hypothetical protein ABIK44_04080 [candidate division WOR-3 bacterium]
MKSSVASRMAFIGLVFAALVLVPDALAQNGGAGSAYDPKSDIFTPGCSRWLYLGSLLVEAPAWAGFINGGLGLEGNQAAGVQLLGTPVSFVGFLLATRQRSTTLGMVALSWNGTWEGAGAGFVLGDLLIDWGQRPSHHAEPRLIPALAGSVACHALGYLHAERRKLNCGNGQMLSLAGLYSGLYAGYLISFAIPFGGYYHLWGETGVPWRRKLVEMATLAGWAGGIYYWDRHAPRNYTTGDGISFGNAAGLGALAASAAYSWLPEEWTRPGNEWVMKMALLVPAVTNAAGLTYGCWFHKERDVTFGQSLLVTLGSVLGATSLGTGTVLLFTPRDEEPDYRIAATASACGGWLGFHITHWFLDTAHPKHKEEGFNGKSLQERLVFMPANGAGLFLSVRSGKGFRAPLAVLQF